MYDEVLTVTAMTDFDGLAGGLASPAGSCLEGAKSAPRFVDDTASFFSNFAVSAVDQAHTIGGPGVCILSTAPGGTYSFAVGTSFASPLVAGTVALCVASGDCAGSPAQIIQKIRADAAAFNTAPANVGYGFTGDPIRPIAGQYYGYLINAGIY